MSQPTFVSGLTTHTLPYPQTCVESTVLRSADFVSYAGTVKRDYVAGATTSVGRVQLGWQALSNAEMVTINLCWREMSADYTGWTYTDPAGNSHSARIDPEIPNLATTRYAGIDGSVLYTARLNLLIGL